MSSNYAIDSLGSYPGMYAQNPTFSYGMDYTYPYMNGAYSMNDPYMQYYMQNYANSPSFKASNESADFSQLAAMNAAMSEPQGAQEVISASSGVPEKKKFGIGKILLATAVVVGTGLTIAAGRKGNKNLSFFSRIADGYKQMFNGVQKSATKLSQEFSLSKTKDGKSFVTIPGKAQCIKAGDIADVAIDANSPITINNLDDLVEGLSKKDVNLKEFVCEIPNYNRYGQYKGKKVRIARHLGDNGKFTLQLIDGNNRTKIDLSDAELTDKFKKYINDCMKQFDNCNAKKLGEFSDIKFFTGDMQNDGLRIFKLDKTKTSFTTELDKAYTVRYKVDSDAVKAYRNMHSNVDEALKEINDKNKIKDNWKVVEGYFDKKGLGTYGDCTFKIQNNEVVGVTIDNKYYPSSSDKFQAILLDNKNIREDILKESDKFYNVKYHLN